MDLKYMPIKEETLSEKANCELERVIPESLDISPEKRVGLAVGWCLTFSTFFWAWVFHMILDQRPKIPYFAEAIWFLGAGIWVPTVIFGFTYGALLRIKFWNVYFKRSGNHDCEVGGVSEDSVAKDLTYPELKKLMLEAICKRASDTVIHEVIITVFWLGIAFICGVLMKIFWC